MLIRERTSILFGTIISSIPQLLLLRGKRGTKRRINDWYDVRSVRSFGLLNIVVNNHIDDDIKRHAQYNDRTQEPQIHRFRSIKKQLWVTATLSQEGAVVAVVVW